MSATHDGSYDQCSNHCGQASNANVCGVQWSGLQCVPHCRADAPRAAQLDLTRFPLTQRTRLDATLVDHFLRSISCALQVLSIEEEFV